ncbi:MAG: ChaN family lipoprotein [Deferrisomatales bacterium]|nr:ChaN family lipoprotein [Deferrisomatales bacterium]
MAEPLTRRTRIALALGLALLAIHAAITWRRLPAPGPERLLRVSDGRELALDEALPALAAARLLFLGEFHDQPAHHRAQLAVIRALHEAGHPVAVGMEMFRADDQQALDRWVEGTLPLEEFLSVYYANWNFPWALYSDMLLYAREHRIPLVGLNLSPELVQQVARRGFGSLGPEQLQQVPTVQCVVDEEYEAFIRRAMGMHGTGGPAFTNFCEAQLLWDTVMAIHLLAYLDENPGMTVAVVAGRGHAWKGGIPARVSQRSAVPMQVLVPKLPDAFQQVEVRPEDADYFWLGLELELR